MAGPLKSRRVSDDRNHKMLRVMATVPNNHDLERWCKEIKALSRFHRLDCHRFTVSDVQELCYFINQKSRYGATSKNFLSCVSDRNEPMKHIDQISGSLKRSARRIERAQLGLTGRDDEDDVGPTVTERRCSVLGQLGAFLHARDGDSSTTETAKDQVEVWGALSRATVKDKRIEFSQMDMTDIMAVARKVNMSPDDAIMARTVFDGFDVDKSGSINMAEFQDVVLQLMSLQLPKQAISIAHVKDVCRQYFAERDEDRTGELDFLEFAQFYANLLKGELLITELQRLQNIAIDHGLSIGYVESLKCAFDACSNHVGVLDFAGFNAALHKAIKGPANVELPSSRVNRFWRELDPKGSGGIVFEQFLRWWIMNFCDEQASDSEFPFETFYKLVRPTHYPCPPAEPPQPDPPSHQVQAPVNNTQALESDIESQKVEDRFTKRSSVRQRYRKVLAVGRFHRDSVRPKGIEDTSSAANVSDTTVPKPEPDWLQLRLALPPMREE